MDNFIYEYTRKVEQDGEIIKSQIVTMKLDFQSTIWTDEKSMIEAANEIWILEEKFKDAMAIHKLILENYRAGE